MFEFLTPQAFNMLVIANLLVGLALIAYRFTRDMQRPIPSQQCEQTLSELSTSALDDTDASSAQITDDTSAQKTQKTNL